MKTIIRLLLNALLLFICAWLIPGVAVSGYVAAIFAAIVLSLVNTFIRPILTILTLPITILTLGLFLFVINGAMVMLASAIVPGFEVSGLLPAIFFAIVLTILNLLFGYKKEE